MRQDAKRLLWGLFVFCAFCALAAGQTPLSCQLANGSVTPTVRAEGLTERVADVVMICGGGTPTASGNALPQVNITVSLNSAVSSRVMDSAGSSEAILTVDEPGSATLPGAPATQLACATPLTGCSITSHGGEPYDGTAGRPNVFEGVVNGDNSVTFYGVPLTAPGGYGINGARVLRITNLRADAAALWNEAQSPTPAAIQATVSIASSPTIAIQGANPLTVAFVQFGLAYQTWNAANTAATGSVSLGGCAAGVACDVATLHFSENFTIAILPRTTLPPNAVVPQQNVPGTIYYSESGFFNTTLASSNPNFATLGVADAGTRLKAVFHGIPAGAQLWVQIYLGTNNPIGATAQLTANEAGPFSFVGPQGAPGGILAAQLPVTNGTATGVWEVLSGNPAAIDTYQIPVFVLFPSGSTPSGTLTIQGTLAPNADNGAFPLAGEAMEQSASYPEPRFTSSFPPFLSSAETYGAWTAGETGASFTITVTNYGATTAGTVTVEDQFPGGAFQPTGMSGSGWSCVPQILVCTRADSLGQGQSYPAIQVTGNVLGGAPAQSLNQVTVSGGGSNPNTEADTVAVVGGNVIAATPSSIVETLSYGSSASIFVNLSTSSATPIAFTLGSHPGWVTFWYQSAGTPGYVSAAQNATLVISFSGASQAETPLTTTLTVIASTGNVNIPVTLNNGAGVSTGSLAIYPTAISWSYLPASVLPNSTTIIMASTNGQIGYTATAVSSNGWLMVNNAFAASGTVGVTPLTIAPSTNLTALAPGTYAGTVVITGSDGSTAVLVVTANVVSSTTVYLASGTNPSVFGRPVTLTATVTPSSAAGNVTFYEGATILGVGTLSSGSASLSTIMLPAGSGKLKAYYAGDASHLSAVSSLTAQVVNTVGGGAFVTGQQLFSDDSLSGVAIADINGDGKADVVAGEQNNFGAELGNGLGTFQLTGIYSIEEPGGIAVGDFNGDGKVDVAVTSIAGNAIGISLGNGDGTFQSETLYPVSNDAFSVVVADFNGDGKADLAVGDFNNNANIFLGNGDGTFQAAVISPVPQLSVSGAAADFNGDGKADLVWVGAGGVGISLGNGDGTFQNLAAQFSIDAAGVAVGDFNGDGKPDLAVTDVVNSAVTILLGNGDGTFRLGTSYPAGGDPITIVVSDFNGDGRADIAAGNRYSSNLTLLLGNGDGTFRPLPSQSLSGMPYSIAAGDFNGDGIADLAVADAYGGGLIILLGTPSPILNVASTHTGSFTLGESGAIYTLTVSNQGGAAATGTVTVTDTLPVGFTATAMSGTNWTCTPATLTCTRSDALNPGASYPPIALTANVSGSAAASVTNQGGVSGGGSPVASASDLTLIFSPCDLKQTGSIGVADVQLIINEALGVTAAVNDLAGTGVVNVVAVQIEINAVLGLGCAAK